MSTAAERPDGTLRAWMERLHEGLRSGDETALDAILAEHAGGLAAGPALGAPVGDPEWETLRSEVLELARAEREAVRRELEQARGARAARARAPRREETPRLVSRRA